MSGDPNIPSLIERFWPFGAFLASSAIAFVIGRERQRWKVDDLGEQLASYSDRSDARFDKLESRLKAMESANVIEATSIATGVAKQDMILMALERMERQIDNKADK